MKPESKTGTGSDKVVGVSLNAASIQTEGMELPGGNRSGDMFPLFSASAEDTANLEAGKFSRQTKSRSAQTRQTTLVRRQGQKGGAGLQAPVAPSAEAKSATVRNRKNQAGQHPVPAGTGRAFASYSSFVTGLSNKLAKSVADIAVAQPGTINPIFISGPTSVGKTHLLEGVYSEYRKIGGRKAPKYLTADDFTSLFVQGFRPGSNGENKAFRSRFSDISLLVVEDIQFLEKKEATQLELVHLIDTLRRRSVQMVFSADRPLADLDLRPELASRLESGIACAIDPPERETLLGIFSQMAVRRNLAIPDEVCRFVVSRYATHARQLSGALNRLHASHLASGRPFSVGMASEVLADLAPCRQKSVTLEEIEKAVSELFNIPASSLRSRSKVRQFSHPRMLAMWLARKYTRSALSEIGRFFGNRSHSTVASAKKRVDEWLDGRAGADCPLKDLDSVVRRAERMLGAIPDFGDAR